MAANTAALWSAAAQHAPPLQQALVRAGNDGDVQRRYEGCRSMAMPLRILLLEDDHKDARMVTLALRAIRTLACELTRAETLTAALKHLGTQACDVGLLDLDLPDGHGLDIVRRIRESAPEIPILVLSGMHDEGLAMQSLQEGAQDYLVKGEVESGSLWRALRYAMERHSLQQGLLSLSFVDDLTGLSNRRGFLTLATQHLKLAYRTGRSFLVGFVDLDNLKYVNDTFGHQEGNHALVDTANVLRNSVRHCDILARHGGDEFCAVIADADHTHIPTVLQRVQEHVRILNAQPNRRYRLSLSVGIVASDDCRSGSIEALLHQADLLMYQEKQQHRVMLKSS